MCLTVRRGELGSHSPRRAFSRNRGASQGLLCSQDTKRPVRPKACTGKQRLPVTSTHGLAVPMPLRIEIRMVSPDHDPNVPVRSPFEGSVSLVDWVVGSGAADKAAVQQVRKGESPRKSCRVNCPVRTRSDAGACDR